MLIKSSLIGPTVLACFVLQITIWLWGCVASVYRIFLPPYLLNLFHVSIFGEQHSSVKHGSTNVIFNLVFFKFQYWVGVGGGCQQHSSVKRVSRELIFNLVFFRYRYLPPTTIVNMSRHCYHPWEAMLLLLTLYKFVRLCQCLFVYTIIITVRLITIIVYLSYRIDTCLCPTGK